MGGSIKVKSSCGWQAVDGFRSENEYRRLRARVLDQVREGIAEETPIVSRYAESDLLDEEWFRCTQCQVVWRLVGPDPPFTGLFEPVENTAPHGR